MTTNNTLFGAVAALALAVGMTQPAVADKPPQDEAPAVEGAHAEFTAAAPAQDDHGDTRKEATLLPIGGAAAGRLGDRSDTDYFRLDSVGLAVVQVRTSGQTDTVGELLDATGARLASDDDGGPGENFDIEVELQPGVYYVAVSGYGVGGYAISARLGGERDHGDTEEASTLLKLHSPEDLASVSPNVLLATAGRIHPDTSDWDWFRLDVADDGTEVRLRTSPAGYITYGILMDTRGNWIADDDDGEGGFQIGATLDRGTYYLLVTGLEVGAYRILAQTIAPPDDGSSRPSGERPVMVAIPSGSFRMGCLNDDGDCEWYELPVHWVTVPGFAMSAHEVTFQQWDACVADGGCGGYRPADRGWGRGDRPVINVDWNDAQSYVAWLSAQTGDTYRLPTEEEWEYAARAGTTTTYYWGTTLASTTRTATAAAASGIT